VALGLAFAAAAFPQNVISAKAGLVNHTLGDVFIDEKPAVSKLTDFPQVNSGQTLHTTLGRAEVLLTPGAILRIAENTRVRMISNALDKVRFELLSGSAIIEVSEVTESEAISMTVAGANIEFAKRGLFRVDFEPARIRVHDGSAVVDSGGNSTTVKEGRQLDLTGVAVARKFNKETGDAFHRWAGRRAGYMAMANISAAKSVRDMGASWRHSGWMFNPYFGSFTYIPYGSIYHSPFGWAYYSPNRVDDLYYRPAPMPSRPMYEPSFGGGMRGRSDMGGHSSGNVYSGPPPSAPSSAPAPAASPGRSGGGDGGSRNSGGGR
jgi:hypothetical protein